MLVWPHQMWLTGITAGIILEVVAGFWNIWTMYAQTSKVIVLCVWVWCEGWDKYSIKRLQQVG